MFNNDDPKDPLEGKGEEMLPERGNPFGEDDDSEWEMIPPPEGENQDAEIESEAIPVEDAPSEISETEPPLDDLESPEYEGDLFEEIQPSGYEFSLDDEEDDPYVPVMDDDFESEEVDPDEIEMEDSFLGEAEIAVAGSPDNELDIPEEFEADRDPAYGDETESFSEVPHPWEMNSNDVDALIGDLEGTFAPPSDLEASFLNDEPIPFASDEEFFQPPEEEPDEGMTAGIEEESLRETPLELMDGGMSAGYPPMTDESTLAQPTESISEPPPDSTKILSEAAFRGPSPMMNMLESKPVQDQELTGEERMLDLLVSDDTLRKLWRRTDKAQEGVIEYLDALPIAQEMLGYIQAARNEMLGGRENYEEAERFINEVEYRVLLRQKLTKLSKGYMAGLFLYEIIWAVGLLLGLIIGLGETAFASTQVEGVSSLTYLFGSMVWGGFGGVIGALLSLVKHVSIKQDFDKQHTWWYIYSPPVGLGIGAIIFLFMRIGLASIIGPSGDISSPAIIYGIAWLAGYQHNIFTDLAKRMLKVLLGDAQSSKDEDEKKPLVQKSKEDKKEATNESEEIIHG